RKNAFIRRSRRISIPLKHAVGQMEFREDRPQPCELLQCIFTLRWRENLLPGGALLWSEQAEPNRVNFRTPGPKGHEFFKVFRATRQLVRHRAMHRNGMSLDVLQDSLVCRGRSSEIVIRLQPIYRHNQLQSFYVGPL